MLLGWLLIIVIVVFFIVLKCGLWLLKFFFSVSICWSCLAIIFALYEIGFCDDDDNFFFNLVS